MAKNQIDVTLDSKQLSELKKSHHQDILKVIGSIDKITKSINTLSYRLEDLGDKIDAISDILDNLEKGSQGCKDVRDVYDWGGNVVASAEKSKETE